MNKLISVTFFTTVFTIFQSTSFGFLFYEGFDDAGAKENYVGQFYINQGEGSFKTNWEYNVENSWLNVNKVWGNSDFSFVRLEAWNPDVWKLKEFDVRARFAWTEGETQGILLGVRDVTKSLFLGYLKEEGKDPLFYSNYDWGSPPNKLKTAPAPEEGDFEFRITRVGTTVTSYINNELFHQTTVQWNIVGLDITVTLPGPHHQKQNNYGSTHADWVAVVPEPAAFSIIAIGGAWLVMRRRVTSSI